MPHAPPGLRASTNARRPLMTSFAGRRKPSFSSVLTAHHLEPRSDASTKIETNARKRKDGRSPGGIDGAAALFGGSLPWGWGALGGAAGGASDIREAGIYATSGGAVKARREDPRNIDE